MATAEGAAEPGTAPGQRPAGHPADWGLLPKPGPDGRLDPAAVLRYWFVEFNPLYFISAFCVLYGVFLIARNVDSQGAIAPERAQWILFAVIQAYEIMLVAGSAFLVHRAGAVRAGVLLAVMESVFLFDATFRLEGVALTGPVAAPLLLVTWWLLSPGKAWALGRAMGVELGRPMLARFGLAAAGLVATVVLLSRPDTDKLMVLHGAGWFGSVVIVMLVLKRPALMSTLARTAEQYHLATRCIAGVFTIVAGAHFYHVWSYLALGATPDILARAYLPQLGAFLLVGALTRPRTLDVWRFGLFAALSTLPAATTLPLALFGVAAAFAWRIVGGARNGLATGATLLLFAGLWLWGWQGWDHPPPPIPGLLSWQALGLGVALVAVAWVLKDPWAWGVLTAGGAYGLYRTLAPLVPRSELGLGMLLLGAGFAAFGIGLAVNWRFRSRGQQAANAAGRDDPAAAENP